MRHRAAARRVLRPAAGRRRPGRHRGAADAVPVQRLRTRGPGLPAGHLAPGHPAGRPYLDPDVRWTGLDVLGVTGGGPLTTEGTVEFRAHLPRHGAVRRPARAQSLQPGCDGRWYYRTVSPCPGPGAGRTVSGGAAGPAARRPGPRPRPGAVRRSRRRRRPTR